MDSAEAGGAQKIRRTNISDCATTRRRLHSALLSVVNNLGAFSGLLRIAFEVYTRAHEVRYDPDLDVSVVRQRFWGDGSFDQGRFVFD
jgi:hypothetical protein